MQEMAPRFSKFYGGACPRTPLANSLAVLGCASRIITLNPFLKLGRPALYTSVGLQTLPEGNLKHSNASLRCNTDDISVVLTFNKGVERSLQ